MFKGIWGRYRQTDEGGAKIKKTEYETWYIYGRERGRLKKNEI